MGIKLTKAEQERMKKIPFTNDMPNDDECLRIIETAFDQYVGDLTVMESAIGALFVGRFLGWKALRILHSNATYGKYEKALGVKFKEILPESTPHSRLMAGVRVLETAGDFWKTIVSGRINRTEGKAYEGRNPSVT